MNVKQGFSYLKQASGHADIKTLLDLLKEYLDSLASDSPLHSSFIIIKRSYYNILDRESQMRKDDFLIALNQFSHQLDLFFQKLQKSGTFQHKQDFPLPPELAARISALSDAPPTQTTKSQPTDDQHSLWKVIGRIALIGSIFIAVITGINFFSDDSSPIIQPGVQIDTLQTLTPSTTVEPATDTKSPVAPPPSDPQAEKPSPSHEAHPIEEEEVTFDLKVFTSVGGVEVYEGDTFLGQTGADDGAKMVALNLTAGAHTLAFKKRGFETARRVVNMNAYTRILSVRMIKLPMGSHMLGAFRSPCYKKYKIVIFNLDYKMSHQESHLMRDSDIFSSDLPTYVSHSLTKLSTCFQILERSKLSLVMEEHSFSEQLKREITRLNATDANAAMVGSCRDNGKYIIVDLRLINLQTLAWEKSTVKKFRKEGEILDFAEILACCLADPEEENITCTCRECEGATKSLSSGEARRLDAYTKDVKKLIPPPRTLGKGQIKLADKVFIKDLYNLAPIFFYLSKGMYNYDPVGGSHIEYFDRARKIYCNGFSRNEAKAVQEVFGVNLQNRQKFFDWIDRKMSR
ncbi:MAG: hypothetical protein AAFW00_28645 [Bacteroidota bacterium]